MRIDDFTEAETDKRAQNRQPQGTSEKGGLSVFLAEAEAADDTLELEFGKVEEGTGAEALFNDSDRGILKTDNKGIIKHGPRKKLEKTYRQLKTADKRDWQALRQVRPAAERFCTADYQTTVIFEPFGGAFVVTRYGAKMFGWNNSQPLDPDLGREGLSDPDEQATLLLGRAAVERRVVALRWGVGQALAARRCVACSWRSVRLRKG